MKRITTFIFLVLTAIGQNSLLAADWSYDFETAKADGVNDRPADSHVTLNGIKWDMYSVRTSDDADDFKNGTTSARMYGERMSMKEMPNMTMAEDKEGGIGSVSFVYRAYGRFLNTQTSWIVQVSEDEGAHWQTIGKAFTPTEEVQTYNAKANVAEGRIRIVRADYLTFETSSSKSYDAAFNLDDIAITDCEGTDPTKPAIIADENIIKFEDTYKGETATENLKVFYKNLSASISLEIADDESGVFSLSKTSIDINDTEGEDAVSISFCPKSVTIYSARLILTSGETSATVILSGKGIRKAGEFTYSGGDGTASNPYLISTCSDLEDLAVAVEGLTDYAGKYFVMTQDIDMSETTGIFPIGTNFGSDGSNLRAFSGTFDGQGHKVKNYNLTYTGKNYIGVAMFGILKDATIKNLTISDSRFQADAVVAALAAVVVNTTITNCHVGENVEVRASLQPYAGGLVCSAFVEPSFITDCSNSARVYSYNMAAGGLLCVNSVAGTTITRCVNYGEVVSEDQYAAGFVAYVEEGSVTITDCANVGSVEAYDVASGMVALIQAGTTVKIQNSYNAAEVSSTGLYCPAVISDMYYQGSVSLSNVYHCSDYYSDDVENSSAMTLAEMKTDSFTSKLNNGRSIWHRISGENNELPVPFGNTSDGISTVFAGDTNALYDLQGHRIYSIPTKGIFIRNNKKIIIR